MPKNNRVRKDTCSAQGCNEKRIGKQAYCQQHKNQNEARARKRRKERVVEYYSRGKNCCAICGSTNFNILEVDHVNGGGSKQRKELGIGAGHNFYLYLHRVGYPDGYRILCTGCNALAKTLTDIQIIAHYRDFAIQE
jgi:hypothetical protein